MRALISLAATEPIPAGCRKLCPVWYWSMLLEVPIIAPAFAGLPSVRRLAVLIVTVFELEEGYLIRVMVLRADAIVLRVRPRLEI